MGEGYAQHNFSKTEKKTFSQIVTEQICNCTVELSKEMRPGYNYDAVIEGKVVTLTAPDQREVTMNSIRTLYDLLLFIFDEEIKEKIKIIEGELESLHDFYFQKFLKEETDPKQNAYARRVGKIAPTSVGNQISQANMNHKVNLYRRIFRELVLLYKRKNELSGKRTLSWKD